MPNSNYPRGLTPVRRVAESSDGAVRRYAVAAADATPLYIGDLVGKTGTSDADGYSVVTRSAAAGVGTANIVGVVEGFEDPTAMQAGFRAGGAAGYVIVNDDPEALFEVQADGVLPAASVGLNADVVVAAPAAGSRQSGTQLAVATAAATATLPLRIVEFQHKPDNDLAAANAKVLVKINTHSERSTTGI